MTDTSHRIDLPETGTHEACAVLVDELSAFRGEPIRLNAEPVARLGGMLLQILLAARKQWQADGQPLTLETPSEPFCRGLERLGLAEDHFAKDAAK